MWTYAGMLVFYMYIAILLKFCKCRCQKRQMLEYPHAKCHPCWHNRVSINCKSKQVKINVKNTQVCYWRLWVSRSYWGLGFEQALKPSRPVKSRKLKLHPCHESTEEQYETVSKGIWFDSSSTPWGFQTLWSAVDMLCEVSSPV